MSNDLETMEDTKISSEAEVTDDSCIAKFIEIPPLDRPSDDYHRPEFIYPVVEVKPEDLQEMKQEPVDENDDGDSYCYVKQEPANEYGIIGSCFRIKVSSLVFMYQLLLHEKIKPSSTTSLSETNWPFIKYVQDLKAAYISVWN